MAKRALLNFVLCVSYIFLDQDALISVVVISCIDYSNVLYVGQSLKSIWKQQLVQTWVA